MYRHQWRMGRVGWIGDWDWQIYSTMYETDDCWEPTMEHWELCSMLCGDLNGKETQGGGESLCGAGGTNTTLQSSGGLVPSCSVLSDSLRPHGLQPARLFCPWNVPGKNTGVGCRFLLQGIFPTQGSNPLLPSPAFNLLQAGSLPLSHLRRPKATILQLKNIYISPSFFLPCDIFAYFSVKEKYWLHRIS